SAGNARMPRVTVRRGQPAPYPSRMSQEAYTLPTPLPRNSTSTTTTCQVLPSSRLMSEVTTSAAAPSKKTDMPAILKNVYHQVNVIPRPAVSDRSEAAGLTGTWPLGRSFEEVTPLSVGP